MYLILIWKLINEEIEHNENNKYKCEQHFQANYIIWFISEKHNKIITFLFLNVTGIHEILCCLAPADNLYAAQYPSVSLAGFYDSKSTLV